MQALEHRQALFSMLKKGAIIITPNNRLSHHLLEDYFKETDEHTQSCDKPRCLPYQALLRLLYKELCYQSPHTNHPILFSQQQQRHLWRQVISTNLNHCHDGIVGAIQEAWSRCQHWQIDAEDPAFLHTPQTKQFQAWQQQYLNQLNMIHAITEEQLVTYILNYPALFDEKTVIWACFDEYTPEQRALQSAIKQAGSDQYEYDLAPKIINTHQLIAKDSQDEYLHLIQWLINKLAEGSERIAVVVPDLQTQSHRLQRLLQRYIPADQFNISLGQSLIHYPLVAHALQWLNLGEQSISNHQARLLLHSPFLHGAKTEFEARAELMQHCKLLQESTLSPKRFTDGLTSKAPSLSALLSSLSDYPDKSSPSEWVEHFKARLIDVGFPGEYPLDSSSYQCFQRLMALIEELGQLSLISPLMDKSQALHALEDLAQSTIFQAQKKSAPIQILGLLEASGCSFEHIWVCGLTDQRIPQKTNLSAFIPIQIQRDLDMPHATAQRELQLAQQLLERLQRGSHTCVFSYPRLTGDTPNLPSPLIKPLMRLENSTPATRSIITHLMNQDDNYLIPLALDETVSGGTALLANQAKCPFRAFAAHRLHAQPVLNISDGPDASERGQLIHRVLDLLWKNLGSQDRLLSLSTKELDELIDSMIHQALSPIANDRPRSFGPLVQSVELKRLHRLVKASLDWEKERPRFIVEAVEQRYTLRLADIDFQVRVDRLDKIMDDKKWVIDYKTSIPSNKPWNEERPEAPQLLLYALLDQQINALLFLQLKAGRVQCSGFSEEPLTIQGFSSLNKGEQWTNRRDTWHKQLKDLAEEFREGQCSPKPTRTSTCEHCDFSNLCRIE